MTDTDRFTVYTVLVKCYEGPSWCEGTFSTRVKAEAKVKEVKEEFGDDAPNIERIDIAEVIVL